MKTLATTLILSVLLFSTSAIAGSGHNHNHYEAPVEQSIVKNNAEKVIASLVERNKVDKSWGAITESTMEKKTMNGSPEWMVIFTNKNITEPDKQKLHVFMTLGGTYVAVNYTGK